MKPGEKYKIYYGPGMPANKVIRILAIVEEQIVVKYWRRAKQRWHYEVIDPYMIDLMNIDGRLRRGK